MTQTPTIRTGAPRLASVKFLSPVRPGAWLEIGFESGPTSLSFTVRDGDTVAATEQFVRADGAPR